MRESRRIIFSFLTGIVAWASLPIVDSVAENYPIKPIRMVLGFTVGGLSDVTARVIAPKLSEHLGQSVVVENRGGAGGAIANERVATSPPDGYTLLLLTNAATVLPALRKI